MCALTPVFLDEGAAAAPTGPAKTYVYKIIANPPPYSGSSEIKADVFAPVDARHRPVVVYFHGGALINGDRSNIKLNLETFCAKQGYVFVTADYRLGPEIKIAGILEDVSDLLKWVSEEGPELFGADPERIVVTGSSAGGYLALNTGAMTPRPKAIVSMWGYGDILADWYTKPCLPYSAQEVDREKAYAEVYKQVLTATSKKSGPAPRQAIYPYLRHEGLWTKEMSGFDPETEREKILPFCPRFNVTADYPPTLLLHGELDDDVPVSESQNMAAALQEKGVEHELVVFTGAGHTLNGATPEQMAEAHAKVYQFLKEQLAE